MASPTESVAEQGVPEETLEERFKREQAEAAEREANRIAEEDTTDEPVLEISTLAPQRSRIKIVTEDHPEGRLFDLADMADFGIEEQQQLTADGGEFDRLWAKEQLSSNEKLRLKQLLDSMFDRLFLAPPEIKALIQDHARSQIVLAFTLAPLAKAAARRAKEVQAEEAETLEGASTTENS